MDGARGGERLIVSEGLLQTDRLGVYLVSDENPAVEYQLIGGCSSIDEAMARARQLLIEHPELVTAPEHAAIQYRKRERVRIEGSLEHMTKEELAESIPAHLRRFVEQLTETPALKTLLSYESCIFLLIAAALWLFWTNSSLSIPETADLPVLGDLFAGVVLNAQTTARYLPIAVFALYLAKFFSLIRTNLQYDRLRQNILALVFRHGWRLENFVKTLMSMEKSMEKSGLGWLVSASDWFRELAPMSFRNLRRQTEAASESVATTNLHQALQTTMEVAPRNLLRAELDQKLADWIPTEFERRVHHLYFLDKEKDYSRFAISFDPVLYLASLNRILFRAYEFLRVQGASIDTGQRPTDPYHVQSMQGPMFWLSSAGQVLIVGGAMVWSLLIAGTASKLLFVMNILAVMLVLIIPQWWNFLTVVKRRGFPKAEPIGAYTVGPLTPNRLSLL